MPDTGITRIPLFSRLSPRDLQRVEDASLVSTLEHRSVAALRGEPATALLIVETGGLSAVHDSADEQRLRFGDFPAPCAVDKVALLDAGFHTATWEAIGTTRLRRVPRNVVLSLIEDVASVRRHVLAHLAAEARRHQDERVGLALTDPSTRIAAWLVYQMETHGLTIPLPHGQAGLGESIGASRVTTNRCLRELARLGILQTRSGSIRILAPEMLTHRVNRTSISTGRIVR